MSNWIILAICVAVAAVAWFVCARRMSVGIKIEGECEVIMAQTANALQFVVVRNLVEIRVSGTTAPLKSEDCQVEHRGPIVSVPIQAWMPVPTQFAFQVTGRGTAEIIVSSPLAPGAEPLLFVIDVDDPGIAIDGNVMIMDAPVVEEETDEEPAPDEEPVDEQFEGFDPDGIDPAPPFNPVRGPSI